ARIDHHLAFRLLWPSGLLRVVLFRHAAPPVLLPLPLQDALPTSSATIPPALAMISRCSAIRCARTCGTAATALTAPVTSRVLIASVTSVPSTRVHGAAGSVLTSMTGSAARLATTRGAGVSAPRSSSHQVSARYIDPVSR